MEKVWDERFFLKKMHLFPIFSSIFILKTMPITLKSSQETLDKMSQRIEVTHNIWDRDSGKPLPEFPQTAREGA